ncbi:hypothetical protein RND71_040559 [Anisodus tanguticus]|uniref:Uncharacterized protein n=1 Tax=Anisodus tanguticus TaxID=243964 RepID=A0AAE1UQC6_9SOLA|nr:hypothetical protein RND71_040559 [Anisodus tanguticus]
MDLGIRSTHPCASQSPHRVYEKGYLNNDSALAELTLIERTRSGEQYPTEAVSLNTSPQCHDELISSVADSPRKTNPLPHRKLTISQLSLWRVNLSLRKGKKSRAHTYEGGPIGTRPHSCTWCRICGLGHLSGPHRFEGFITDVEMGMHLRSHWAEFSDAKRVKLKVNLLQTHLDEIKDALNVIAETKNINHEMNRRVEKIENEEKDFNK